MRAGRDERRSKEPTPMLGEATAKPASCNVVFPFTDVLRRLQAGVRDTAEESTDLRGDWEPLLDSLRMVSVLVSLEDLFDFPLPPEKLVRRGGYSGKDEAVEDMFGGLQRLWEEKHKSGGRS